MGKAHIPVIIMVAGGILKLILNITLVSIPEINIYGTSISTVVCYLFMFIIALTYLLNITKIKLNFSSVFIRPFISSVICIGASYLSYNLLKNIIDWRMSLIFAVIVACVFYVIFLFLTKSIVREDIEMLPKGTKLADFLQKKHLIR